MRSLSTHLRLEKPARYLALVSFEVLFLAGVTLLRLEEIRAVSLWVWPLVALAANRTARAITKDYVFTWLRAPFADEYGDGVNPDLHPFWHSFGKMIFCPICAGTWAALVLTILVTKVDTLGIPLAMVLSLASGAEIVNHYLEGKSSGGIH